MACPAHRGAKNNRKSPPSTHKSITLLFSKMSIGIRLLAAMSALLLGKEVSGPTGAALHNRYSDVIGPPR